MVARICYERIERKEEIEKLTATDWYAHPKFEERWNNRLSGPEGQMFDMVVSDLKKAGLWYYYLEVEWKMTGELAEIRDSHKDGYWARCCSFAVKDNPEERVWFLRVCADLFKLTPPPSRVGWLLDMSLVKYLSGYATSHQRLVSCKIQISRWRASVPASC